MVIVSANKPRFFSGHDPIYRVVDEDESLLLPHTGPLEAGHVYFGGNAHLVEESLDVSGGQPLYVGDHLFGDVHVTKDVLRWRTALIARELEAEVADAIAFDEQQHRLEALMAEKIEKDRRQAQLRLARAKGRGAEVAPPNWLRLRPEPSSSMNRLRRWLERRRVLATQSGGH